MTAAEVAQALVNVALTDPSPDADARYAPLAGATTDDLVLAALGLARLVASMVEVWDRRPEADPRRYVAEHMAVWLTPETSPGAQ